MPATFSFEIEITLDGETVPYVPATGPTYASGGQPAEGGYVEGLAITDASLIQRLPEKDRTSPSQHYRMTSFLKDVDLGNPEVRKLLNNLLELVREDAERAVLDEDRWAA